MKVCVTKKKSNETVRDEKMGSLPSYDPIYFSNNEGHAYVTRKSTPFFRIKNRSIVLLTV